MRQWIKRNPYTVILMVVSYVSFIKVLFVLGA
jgi:hypothetical protein